METSIDAAVRNGRDAQSNAQRNGASVISEPVPGVDNATGSARRKFDAACEVLHAFEPDAEQLDAAAIAIMKVVAKGLRRGAAE